jgi:hypothetical protein
VILLWWCLLSTHPYLTVFWRVRTFLLSVDDHRSPAHWVPHDT